MSSLLVRTSLGVLLCESEILTFGGFHPIPSHPIPGTKKGLATFCTACPRSGKKSHIRVPEKDSCISIRINCFSVFFYFILIVNDYIPLTLLSLIFSYYCLFILPTKFSLNFVELQNKFPLRLSLCVDCM